MQFILFQGKHIGRLGHQDPGEFPEEVKALFEKAVQYYEDNMMLMVEIGDRAAQGRACGNLGESLIRNRQFSAPIIRDKRPWKASPFLIKFEMFKFMSFGFAFLIYVLAKLAKVQLSCKLGDPKKLFCFPSTVA